MMYHYYTYVCIKISFNINVFSNITQPYKYSILLTVIMHFRLCVYVCTEGAVIEVTDEQPPSSTMSLVLTDIVGLRTYCTGLRFYRPFIVEEVNG